MNLRVWSRTYLLLWCEMISHGYLFRFRPVAEEQVHHVSWDEDHGGEGHEPADALTPRWEHVVIHFERNHLDGAEQKHSLQKKRRRLRRVMWQRRFLLSKPVYFSSPSLCGSKLQTLENGGGLSEISALRKSSSSAPGFVYGSNHYASTLIWIAAWTPTSWSCRAPSHQTTALTAKPLCRVC